MAGRGEISAVYAAGLVQGVAYVTFPASSTIFTSSDDFGLSHTQYGAMFLPQAATSIAASLLGAGLARRWGVKRLLLIGLLADSLSMLMLLVSRSVMASEPLAYVMLLVSTSFLGLGFGLTVPAVNALVAGFFPSTIDRAVLVLNALLGFGTLLAPVLVALFIARSSWAGLPLSVAAVSLALFLFSLRLPLQAMSAESLPGGASRAALPTRFWVFAAFATLYGIVETMNGNWATIYLVNELAATAASASLALTAFWGMVTVGRVLFALAERRLPEQTTFRILPFVIAIALVIIATLPAGSPLSGIVAFALAGLGCSALVPLVISFGQEQLKSLAASVTGLLVAFYQIGYACAAFGVGPLEGATGLGLREIYGLTTIVALVMACLSFVLVSRPGTARRLWHEHV